MGGNGKQHRWKISFHRSSSSTSSKSSSPSSTPKASSAPAAAKTKEPPTEFVCQISGTLIADPVIVSSGQTFERVSVQVCRDLRYLPLLSDGSRPDFSNLIPNMAIKSTILHWCDANAAEHPVLPDYRSVESIVRKLMISDGDSGSEVRVSETELLRGVAEKPPPVTFSHAATAVNIRPNHFYSSSSEESVVVSTGYSTPLVLSTRPACYSSSSSSSEIVSDELLSISSQNNPSSPEEEEFISKMKSNEVFDQEQAVISLRKLTRTNEQMRVSLCSTRLLAALRPMILSRYSVVQTNAMAALVNLSLEKVNKVKIVRSGMVPALIDVLKGGFAESQEHAAGAIFSLSLEDDNKTAIGVLGGLQPLMHALRAESDRTRHDSALALYHLSLVQSNRVKLVKLGAVATLLTLLQSNSTTGRVILILCNLAACNEGKSVMLDGNAVGILVGMIRNGDELDSVATRENVVAALYSLSHGSLRFKGLARDAGAVEVLRMVEEKGSELAKEKAKRMLQMMRGRDAEEDGDHRWDSVLDSGGGLSRTRYRVGLSGGGKSLYGVNSTEF